MITMKITTVTVVAVGVVVNILECQETCLLSLNRNQTMLLLQSEVRVDSTDLHMWGALNSCTDIVGPRLSWFGGFHYLCLPLESLMEKLVGEGDILPQCPTPTPTCRQNECLYNIVKYPSCEARHCDLESHETLLPLLYRQGISQVLCVTLLALCDILLNVLNSEGTFISKKRNFMKMIDLHNLV